MTDDEMEQILYKIIDLAHLLGWSTGAVQDKNGNMVGMYIGEHSWIQTKIMNTASQTKH